MSAFASLDAFPAISPSALASSVLPSAPAAFGDASQAAGDAGLVLGALLGTGIGTALGSPQVQQQLAVVQAGVRDSAKQGVIDAVKQYWYVIPIAALTFSMINYSMLILGVVPLVRPRR
jgi:hypothetical protein